MDVFIDVDIDCYLLVTLVAYLFCCKTPLLTKPKLFVHIFFVLSELHGGASVQRSALGPDVER